MKLKRGFGLLVLLMLLVFAAACSSDDASSEGTEDETETGETTDGSEEEATSGEPIKIGVLASLSGALESYGKQTKQGFELGIEYATDGTNEIEGRPIEVVYADTETDPKVARQKAIGLLEDDKVDFLVGSSSSGDTLAVLPLAEEYKKIMVVEPAVADSITGKDWNKYVFRTARNSSQDAVAGAAAIAKDGVKIATLAPDYSFGRDGVAAFTKAAKDLGAEIVHEEYADPTATDFTANIQKIIQSEPDYLFVIWAGANSPWNQISDMKLQEKGIKISTGAPDIAALSTMKELVGMEGFTVYYHTLPDNEINDWLVEKHQEKYDAVPDLFTPGGMSAALSITEALKKTGGKVDADELITTMEGMSFETPKGTMTFREEDHQALQSLYKIRLEEQEGVDYPVPVLERVLTPEETAPPIQN
ncbi:MULTISPECIES: substrate-binding domain-containing protein [Pontibacillus]|uniref:Substrate-binding domain-containing protein n=1 Tax=Pontibacillus chungwhensis TaxID=265426 RepID=A0ABY8V3B5_9BACI|nr:MULTISPECIES: substrate-binding domain-containing protein [Pontibacillus]MCD5325819.1 substrate-binding domain-containing protein [Pontibacillus sp. HN14]WIF98351.1 substrate-binding domain-containing protein [Pontibacillus chungwhensis]